MGATDGRVDVGREISVMLVGDFAKALMFTPRQEAPGVLFKEEVDWLKMPSLFAD